VFGASGPGPLAPADIYLAASADGGATFRQAARLTHACGSAWSPAAAVDAAGALWATWYQAVAGTSQLAWLRLSAPGAPGTGSLGLGAVADSQSPFTTSRSPVVSLGDFVGLASSGGVTVAAWTSLRDVARGGATIQVSATSGEAD
jgi:hypothetical protein